jgi:hypothetical protein
MHEQRETGPPFLYHHADDCDAEAKEGYLLSNYGDSLKEKTGRPHSDS